MTKKGQIDLIFKKIETKIIEEKWQHCHALSRDQKVSNSYRHLQTKLINRVLAFHP